MRYLYFYIIYNQWFKNHNGIKAFANQAIHWLLESTLSLSKRLKEENKRLSENVKVLKSKLIKRLNCAVINADEYPAIRSKIRLYTLIIFICLTGETFFNYFAARAIFTFQGWTAVIASLIFSMLITLSAILLFENLIEQILLEPHYKSEKQKNRNILKMVILFVLAITYEYLIYYVCKVRGIQIEGGNGDGIVSTAMMIAGMLLPVVGGYYSYEKGRFISAYKNTNKVTSLEKEIAKSEMKIHSNNEKMENHFKKTLNNRWAVLQEFKTYKENYNLKHSIPEENLMGHFCATQETFRQEAIERYNKQNIYNDSIQNLRLYDQNKDITDQSIGYSVN